MGYPLSGNSFSVCLHCRNLIPCKLLWKPTTTIKHNNFCLVVSLIIHFCTIITPIIRTLIAISMLNPKSDNAVTLHVSIISLDICNNSIIFSIFIFHPMIIALANNQGMFIFFTYSVFPRLRKMGYSDFIISAIENTIYLSNFTI